MSLDNTDIYSVARKLDFKGERPYCFYWTQKQYGGISPNL
jgi:hypothetical protein